MPRSQRYQFKPTRSRPTLLKHPTISLEDLAKGTQFQDRQNSRTVRLRTCDPVTAPQGMRQYQCMRATTQTDENGHQYSPRIFWQGTKPLTRKTPVIVDCPCGRHVFTYETANAHHGCSFIYRSNGEPPHTTNPQMVPGLCKHIYSQARYLLTMAKNGGAGKGKVQGPRGPGAKR